MKLRKKLLLSCAALAACATTLVSTTFAWYTSNTTVTASNITTASAASGSELLLISEDATNWNTEITDVTETTPTGGIKPVEFSDNVLKAMNSDATVDGTDFTSFTLYIKNASTKTGNLKVAITSLTNETATLPSKSIIGEGAQYLGLASSASDYTVDALRVLCMEVETTVVDDGTAEATPRTDVAYDLEKLAELKADSLTGKSGGAVTPKDTEEYVAGSVFNAHQYYNMIMTPTIDTTDSTVLDPSFTTTSTYVDLGVLPTAGTAATANDYLKITFKLFLNGWDLACFDACQGQSFKMALSFKVE